MKQLLLAIMLMLTFGPCAAKNVKVKQVCITQTGRPRMPSMLHLNVEVEGYNILTTLSGYNGDVHITIFSESGSVADELSATVAQYGLITMNESKLPEGLYKIRIYLGSAIYEGTFVIEK